MARAYRFTVIRVPASSRENAHEIIGRLRGIGLPRPSMDVAAQGGSYHVVVHTHEDNRERIMRAAGHGFTGQGMNRAVLTGTAVGSAALIGAGLWAAWRNRDRLVEFLAQSEDLPRFVGLIGGRDRVALSSASGDPEATASSRREPDQAFNLLDGSTAMEARQPRNAEQADGDVRTGTEGAVHAIS